MTELRQHTEKLHVAVTIGMHDTLRHYTSHGENGYPTPFCVVSELNICHRHFYAPSSWHIQAKQLWFFWRQTFCCPVSH